MYRMITFSLFALTLLATPALSQDSPAPAKLDATTWTCKELMAGRDHDRAAGIAFFHGYNAGKSGTTVFNVSELGDLSDRVKDFCLSNPSTTVLDAFAKSAQ
jgi:hypothetical protein